MVQQAWQEMKKLFAELSTEYKVDNPVDKMPTLMLEAIEKLGFIEMTLLQMLNKIGIGAESLLEILENENNRELFIRASSEQRERLWSCVRTACLIVLTMKF